MIYQIETDNVLVQKLIAFLYWMKWARVVQQSDTISKAEFFADLRSSFQEMHLHRQGKIELRSAREVVAFFRVLGYYAPFEGE